MRPLTVLAAAGALMLAVAGCGGSSDGGGGGGGGGPITMRDLKFAPATAQVKVGEKVTWRNDDSVDHNVTATSGAKFKSRAFGKAKTFSFTPRKPGRIAYVCTLHPGMKATLEVSR